MSYLRKISGETWWWVVVFSSGFFVIFKYLETRDIFWLAGFIPICMPLFLGSVFSWNYTLLMRALHPRSRADFIVQLRRLFCLNPLTRNLIPAPGLSFVIRPYREQDRSEMLRLYEKNAPGHFPKEDHKYFESYLDQASSSFFVAETTDKKIIACGGVVGIDEHNHVLCYGLVDPPFQGQGVGSTMAMARLIFAGRRDYPNISNLLAVQSSISFYERLGYEVWKSWQSEDGIFHPVAFLTYSSEKIKPAAAILKERGHLIDPAIHLYREKKKPVSNEVNPA